MSEEPLSTNDFFNHLENIKAGAESPEEAYHTVCEETLIKISELHGIKDICANYFRSMRDMRKQLTKLEKRLAESDKSLASNYSKLSTMMKNNAARNRRREEFLRKFIDVVKTDSTNNRLDNYKFTTNEIISQVARTVPLDNNLVKTLEEELDSIYKMHDGKVAKLIGNPFHPYHNEAKGAIVMFFAIIKVRLANTEHKLNYRTKKLVTDFIAEQENFLSDI